MAADRPRSAPTRARTWDDVAAFAERRWEPLTHGGVPTPGLALHPTDDVVVGATDTRSAFLGSSRSVLLRYAGGEARELGEGRLPTWSPDGRTLAHLDGAAVRAGHVRVEIRGAVERLTWNPDGSQLLLVVADEGSEVAALAGSGLVPHEEEWAPTVESTDAELLRRRLLVLDASTGAALPASRPDLTVWDACWAGERVLALCSDGASESAWYTADLRLLDPTTGDDTVVVRPVDQVGPLSASPSGRRLAWVESVCSDRGLVAGELRVLDLPTGQERRLAVPAEGPIDVTEAAFVSEDELGFVGLRGLTTVLGFTAVDGGTRVLWESTDSTAAGVHPHAAFRPGRAALVHVGPRVCPEVLLVRDASTAPDVLAPVAASAAVSAQPGTSRIHRWTAPDGWEIEGWLHLPGSRPDASPDAGSPHPLVVALHGGPVASHRAGWSTSSLLVPLLLEHGYAVLMPNPRGSSGRGQEFARAVVGDMGGADAVDIVSGVEALVADGAVDPARIGVVGGSYGGYLAAWLVARTEMFAAAVAQHPITDWTFQHGTAAMPGWDELFLDGKPYVSDGQYVRRSPLAHADAVRTPTLFVAGGLDRATPPGQALAMHRALAARGVPSTCVTYLHSGHGPRDLPTLIDSTARTVEWFERWMPATPAPPGDER